MTHRLLPEWVPIEAVILAWPHENTDWAPWLTNVRSTYCDIIRAINQAGAGVILLCRPRDIDAISNQLPTNTQAILVATEYNDTWVRDYAFLTCSSDHGPVPIEFTFNGWGRKFNADKDNQVNQSALSSLCNLPIHHIPIVCEGGALEINDSGHLLSTQLCLTNPQRNADLSLSDYRRCFATELGAQDMSIFKHGYLQGDDTDGHIDTLVRFTPSKGLVIQSCQNRPEDPHFVPLTELVKESQQALPGYDIFELPLPCIVDNQGERLPASYANFLICNDTVLCPVYQQIEDMVALEVINAAFPNHSVVPIDSSPLIQQFGSLHCITMQIPKGTLKSEVSNRLSGGVTVYAQ